MNAEISRPPGLIFLVIVTAVIAVLDILVYGLGLIAVFVADVELESSIVILVGFVFSVAMAVAAHRLWYLERWAPRLAQIVYAISIISTVSAIALGEGTGLDFFLLLLLIWMLFYVSTKRIRALYIGGPFEISNNSSKDSEPALQPRDRYFS